MGYNTEYFSVPCNCCGTSGRVRCGNCQATGAVTCAGCQGKTYITCRRCEGRTELVSFLTVVRTLDPSFQTVTQFNNGPDESIQGLLNGRIGVNDLLSVEAAEDSEIATSLVGMPHAAAVPILAKKIRQLLSVATERVSQDCRCVWQSVEVQQSVAAMVRYEFNGKEYEAWTVGKNADLLPNRNPFSDLVQADFERAMMAWEKGDKQQAIECLCRCRAIASKDQQSKLNLDACEGQLPVGLKTAAAVSSTMVAGKAKLISGVTKVSEAVDAMGKWFKNRKGDSEGKKR